MNRVVYLHGFASSPGSKKAGYFRERFAARGIELEIPDLAQGDFDRLTITRQLGSVSRWRESLGPEAMLPWEIRTLAVQHERTSLMGYGILAGHYGY